MCLSTLLHKLCLTSRYSLGHAQDEFSHHYDASKWVNWRHKNIIMMSNMTIKDVIITSKLIHIWNKWWRHFLNVFIFLKNLSSVIQISLKRPENDVLYDNASKHHFLVIRCSDLNMTSSTYRIFYTAWLIGNS